MPVPYRYSQRPRVKLPPPTHRVKGILTKSLPDMEVFVVAETVETVTDSVTEEIFESTPDVVDAVEVFVESTTPNAGVTPPVVYTPKVWNPGMKKADLLTLAIGFGLSVTELSTKAEIVEALRASGK